MNIELEDVQEKIDIEIENTNKDSLTLKKDIDPFDEYECDENG